MHTFLSRALARFMIASSLLAGCASSPPAQSPTRPPAPATTSAPLATIAASAPTQAAAPATTSAPTDDDIKAAIQQTLDRFAQAYNDNQPDMLKQVVDQSNLPFRRLVQGRFESYQKSIFAGQITFDYKVDSIKQRDLGFVQAQVTRASDGAVADWLFRQVNGMWLLSEPTEQQIGRVELLTVQDLDEQQRSHTRCNCTAQRERHPVSQNHCQRLFCQRQHVATRKHRHPRQPGTSRQNIRHQEDMHDQR